MGARPSAPRAAPEPARIAAANDAQAAAAIEASASLDLWTESWVCKARTTDPGTLQFVRTELPQLTGSLVRVRVAAAALNPVDIKRMNFAGGASSLAHNTDSYRRDGRHSLPPFPFPYVVGLDGAGVVEAVGPDAQGIEVGDHVVFHLQVTKAVGSCSKVVYVEATTLCKLPAEACMTSRTAPAGPKRCLSFLEAAALPCAAWTAYVALFDKLQIASGRHIFIDGGAGGVGSFAIQFAKVAGCFVYTTCSAHNVAYCKSLGADVVIDYHEEDVVMKLLSLTEDFGVDYLVSAVSAANCLKYAQAVRFGGGIAQIAGLLTNNDDFFFTRQLSIHYVFLGGLHHSPVTQPMLQQLGAAVFSLLSSGKIIIPIETVQLERVPEAMKMLSGGHTRGKVVVEVDRNICKLRPPAS